MGGNTINEENTQPLLAAKTIHSQAIIQQLLGDTIIIYPATIVLHWAAKSQLIIRARFYFLTGQNPAHQLVIINSLFMLEAMLVLEHRQLPMLH